MSRPFTSVPKTTIETHHQDSITNYKPQFYVPKVTKSTQNIHELQSSTTLRPAPQSRDFKKTIPKNITQDKERLYEELNKYKEHYNAMKMENYKLKSRIQNQDEEMVRLVDQQPVTRSTLATNSYSVDQAQHSITLTLKKQVKQMGDALEDKELEMSKIKRNVKLTKIYEIEAELKAYQDETIRLKHMIQQFLRTRHKGQINQTLEDKYLAQMGQLEEQQQMSVELQEQVVSISEALQQSITSFKELELNYQKVVKDKTLLQKILQDKEKDIDRLKGNENNLNRRTTQTSDGQLKLELERKLIECNQLKNQNTLKERKCHELDKKLKEVTNDLTYKVNHEMREKITNKDKSDKYRLELMELQDKYQQLVFNSRVAAPTNLNTPLARKATFVSQHSDEGEQSSNMMLKLSQHEEKQPRALFQANLRSTSPTTGTSSRIIRRTTMKSLPIITKEDVEQIGTELRYKLRGKQIRASEVDYYLFSEGMRDKTVVSISDLIQQLQKEPFSLPQNESVSLSRYLVEPQGTKEIVYNMNLQNENGTVVESLQNLIGKYGLILGEDRVHIHNIVYIMQIKIRTQYQIKQEEIRNILKMKKIQDNSTLPGNCYSRESFLMALIQTALDEEQQDVFMQTLFEITNDFNIIDLDVINKHWPPKGQLATAEDEAKKLRTEPQVVKFTIDAILAYAETKNISILVLRAIIDEDKSGFVDRSELVKFLKSCEVNLDPQDLMEVVDFFDEAGDGRISVNNVGSVLKAAQHLRESQLDQVESSNKSIEALNHILAQYIIEQKNDMADFFAMIDESRQGYITKEELRKFFRIKLVIPISGEEFDDFFVAFELTPDGDLEYSEFAKVIGKAIKNFKAISK